MNIRHTQDQGARRRAVAWLFVLGGALAWSGPVVAAEPVHTLTVAVVPQFSAADIARTWTPLLERLGERVGVRFELKLSKDIPSFERDVVAGLPDLAYMNPFHQVRARQAQGYEPLVRDMDPLTGIIVVKRDAPVQRVDELTRQAVAFPAPNAFGASLLVRAYLDEVEHAQVDAVYVRTHTNAYRHTLRGLSVAAGGVRSTLEREPAEVREGLRILVETPGAAPHPFSAHPRVSKEMRERIRAAWLVMAKDPTLQESLRAIPMPRPVAADQVRDYDPVARLRLDRYAE